MKYQSPRHYRSSARLGKKRVPESTEGKKDRPEGKKVGQLTRQSFELSLAVSPPHSHKKTVSGDNLTRSKNIFRESLSIADIMGETGKIYRDLRNQQADFWKVACSTGQRTESKAKVICWCACRKEREGPQGEG